MVVGEDDSGAVVLRRVDDDAPQRQMHAGLVAFVAADMEAARLIVDMGDPQAFAADIIFGKAAGEELPSGRQSI
jgi:hypothetical protein